MQAYGLVSEIWKFQESEKWRLKNAKLNGNLYPLSWHLLFSHKRHEYRFIFFTARRYAS